MFLYMWYLRSCVIGINRFWLVGLVGFLLCSMGEKPFSVGLVDQLFQPASNRVDAVEKALA